LVLDTLCAHNESSSLCRKSWTALSKQYAFILSKYFYYLGACLASPKRNATGITSPKPHPGRSPLVLYQPIMQSKLDVYNLTNYTFSMKVPNVLY